MKNLRNKIIGGAVFVLLIAAIGAFGYNRFQAHETVDEPSHVLVLSGTTAADIQSMVTAKPLPIVYVLCPKDTCALQHAIAEEAAINFDGQVYFIQVDPHDLPEMKSAVAGMLGVEAYPAYLFVSESNTVAVNGVMSADALVDFVQQAMSSHVVTLTEDNKQQVSSSSIPIFYTVCTPDLCKLQRPALEELAAQYDGKVLFVIADAVQFNDLTQAIAQQVGAVVFPMYIFVSPSGNFIPAAGVLSPDSLEQIIQAGLYPTTPAATAVATTTSSPDASAGTATPSPSQSSTTAVAPPVAAGGK